MKTLFSYYGGSHAYGLNNENSDLDLRYLFIHQDIHNIIGLGRHEHQSSKEGLQDNFGWELKHFMGLCKKANTQTVEALFLPKEKYLTSSPEWEMIMNKREQLLDSEQFYKCIRGYSQGEKNLVTGNRSGALGEKRKAAIEKYGYSYKNLSHLFRLLISGISFFNTGIYAVDMSKENYIIELPSGLFNPSLVIRNVKMNPQVYSLEWGLKVAEELEERLELAFRFRTKNYVFDLDVANELIYSIYMPELDKHKTQNKN